MKEIVCPNCGATFDAREPKCPYCEYINPLGAEAKYLRDLEDTRLNLDNVDEEAEDAYIKDIKSGAKFALKRIIVIVLLIAIFVGGGFVIHKIKEGKKGNFSDELLWEQENFPIFDEMLDEGKYEELMELFLEYGDEHNIWNWERYDEFEKIASELWGTPEEQEETGEDQKETGEDGE